MGSHSSPEISCALCSKPVDLRVELCTDENGRAIHKDCYMKRLVSDSPEQNAEVA